MLPPPSSVTKTNYGPEVYKELPEDWLKGLNIKTQVASPNYDVNKNKYKVKCGGSLEMWETSGWIVEQDPYGWFQWYCRFFQVSFSLPLVLSVQTYIYSISIEITSDPPCFFFF